ncbi:MAG: SH3 domain-containing protein [bacterium]|nr:SH3 domain-containing protein [bacterium]
MACCYSSAFDWIESPPALRGRFELCGDRGRFGPGWTIPGIVSGETVRLRAASNLKAEIVTTLDAPMRVRILQVRRMQAGSLCWYLARTADDAHTGWIRSDFVGLDVYDRPSRIIWPKIRGLDGIDSEITVFAFNKKKRKL